MADDDNFFSQFDPGNSGASGDDSSAAMPSAAPQPAAPAPVPDDQNYFSQFDPANEPENQTGGLSSFIHGAERAPIPIATGLAAAGAGAEIGAAFGAPFGGVGAIPGGVIGGIVGGVAGGMLGGTAGEQVQDWGLHALPEQWQDVLGQSDRQRKLDETYHPTESFLGGILPYVLTMAPFSAGSAAAGLAENATAWQRIAAHPIVGRLFGGAMMGGMEAAQEQAQGQVDWRNVAISTGFGMVFNRPNRIGEAITNIGAAPRLAAEGEPAAPAQAEPSPTVAQAGDAKVMGPGITEDVFMGSHQQAPAAAMTAQDAARTEASIIGPQPPAPDPAVLARKAEPELFGQYDALQSQISDLRDHLATLASPPDEDIAAASARRDDLQTQLDAHIAERGGYASGPQARAFRAQIRDVQGQVDALTARRDAFAAGQGADTPEMTSIRQQIMATDIQLRDLAPQVGAAYRRAAEYGGSETVEPEATTPEEPIRFYHGEKGEPPTSGGSRFVTPSFDYARDFRAMDGVPNSVHYVDLAKDEAIQHGVYDEINGYPQNGEVPEEVAKRMQPVEANVSSETSPAGPVAPAVQEQAAAIASDVARQLIAAGRSPEEAEASGQLIGSHYAARAARFGGARGTAQELYNAEGPVIRGVGRTQAAPAASVEAPAAIDPAEARAVADSTGTSKLIQQLIGRGASNKEIADTIGRKLSEDQVAAFRKSIPPAEVKPPLMPTVAEPEIGRPAESVAAVEPEPTEPTTVNQNVAPTQASEIEALDPANIGVDAKRFQFKAGGDESGVTERLQGVEKWDPRLAGTALVYRDADGKDWIADGHQRLALAKRLSESQPGIRLNSFVLNAADGVTDAQARGIAAIKNIAEGTGTAVDAAKVMRDAKETGIDLPPLPPKSTLVRDGKALTELSPDAFGIIVNEVVPPAQGAIVGRLVKDPTEQVEALRLLSQAKPENNQQAEMIVRDMLGSGTEQMTRQGGLFGEEAFASSVVLERAKIADEAVKQLRKDKATFNTLVKESDRIVGAGQNVLDQAANQSRLTTDEKASDLLTQLAFRAGPVSDALSDIARRLKSGDLTVGAAGREFLGAIRGAVEGGVDTGAEPSRPVAGPASERQELATEPGAEGLPQTLIPGVAPITEAERVSREAERPLTGGESAPGGLFDEDAQNQRELFQPAYHGTPHIFENDLLSPIGASKMIGSETTILDHPDLKVSEADNKGSSGRRSLRYVRYQDGEPIAALQIMTDGKRSKKATIQNVYTVESMRRQQVAANLLKRARQDFDVRHSDDLTNDGRAFKGADGTFYQSNDLSEPTVDPRAAQTLMHSAGLDTPEKLADFGKRVTASAKGSGILSRKSDAAVMDQMRRAAVEQGEVLDSVVATVPVDVVNNLFASENAAKMALHDEAVLKDGSAFDAQLPVSDLSDRGRAVRLLMGEVARIGAERASLSAVPVSAALEGASAGGADQGGDFNQGKRASITFKPGQKPIIKLFAEANASSFLHETGHQWLEELMRDAAHPAANDSLKGDAQTVKSWLGMEGDTIATKQHEKFARGFEQYMREGVAPNAGLARVFAQFKTWLSQIYQSIKGLGTPINDDIRSVFDRLIAEEPRRTVITGERTAQPSIATVHETDAAEAHPAEAEPAGDRIIAERDAYIANQPPEVQNELATAEVERAAATATAEPGAEAGTGAGGQPEVGNAGGIAEPQPAGGISGGERGTVQQGSSTGAPEGAGVPAGPATAGAGANADAGLRQLGPQSASGARAQPLAPSASDLFGEQPSKFLDKAGNIRLDNINADTNLKQVLRDAAAANNDFIGDRRGRVTDGQVLAFAYNLLGTDPDFILRKKIGEAFSAEEIKAAEILISRSAMAAHDAMQTAATGTDKDVIAYAAVRARHQMLQAKFSQATAEAGRAERATRKTQALWSPQAQTADQFLRDATGKTLFQLRAEAKLGATLDSTADVGKFLHDATKSDFWDGVLEYWTNALISNPATHATYAVGSEMLALMKAAPETAAAAAIGAIRRAAGREGEVVHLAEVAAQLRAHAESVPASARAATDALRTGTATLLPGEKGKTLPFQPRGQFAPGATLNENYRYSDVLPDLYGGVRGILDGTVASGYLAKLAQGDPDAPLVGFQRSQLGVIPNIAIRGVTALPIGEAARLPSRSVGALHSFFRATNYSMEKARLAVRQASEEGLSGTDFDARVADLRQNPTPEMMEQARGQANELTLMGQGSKFVQALSRLTNTRILGIPMLKFIDPFVKIGGNVIDQSIVQRTPVGLLSPEVRADLSGKNGNIAQDTAQARMLVGTALSVGFGALAAKGLLTGSGPSDPDKAAVWRMAGNQAHSIRIGDTFYNVGHLGPLGMTMGVAADMYDVAHQASEGDLLQAASTLQHAITQNILDQSFMRGPADLVNAVDDPGRYGQSYIRNFISSFIPYSSAMAQMARSSDPYSRQARSVMDAIKAKVPGMSESLFPRRDIWGNPLPNLPSFGGLTAIYMSQVSRDPVNQALSSLGIGIGQPDRLIRNVHLTDDQYDYYSQIAGRMLKQRLDTFVSSPDWQTWSPETRVDVINETKTQSRETARGMVMARYPQIASQATLQKLAPLRRGGQ